MTHGPRVDALEFRKRTGGLCLIAAPLLLGAGDLLRLSTGSDGADLEVAGLTRDGAGVWIAVGTLEVAGAIVAFPALGALLHLFTRRATALGHLAVGFLVTAFVCQAAYIALVAAANGASAQLTRDGDIAAGDSYVTVLYANTLEGPASLLGFVATVTLIVGLLALANAIWCSKLFGRSVASAVAAAGLLMLIEWEILLLDAVPYVLLSVAWGVLGWKTLAMSAMEWERLRVVPAADR